MNIIMKKLLLVIVAAAMVLGLAACSQPAEESAAPAETAEAQAESPADTPGIGEGDETKTAAGGEVSILTPYLSSVTTNQMCEALQAGLEANGLTVNVVDTKGDFAQLASRIEDVVSAKTGAIILVSVDPTQVETPLQAAFDADIPVFGCDSGLIDGMQLNATSDNYAMGEMITRYLFDDLMGGEGTVIALTHRPHPGVVKRSEAFDDLMKEYPDITLITEQHVEVPGPIDSARSIVDNLLLSNSEEGSITAIWCAWDEPAIGATQALQDAGRDDVIVTGVDGNEQALALIDEISNLKATAAQNFEGMAGIVVEEVTNYFAGSEVKTGDIYAEATIIKKD